MLLSLLSFKNLFALFITVCFAYGVWEARNFDFLAKVFPFYISLGMLVLAVINLIQEITMTLKHTETKSLSFSDLNTEWDIPIKEVWRRFVLYVLMILGIYAAIWVIGYPVALTLFIVVFYRFVAGARWWAAGLAGLTALGFLALTSYILTMVWPEGLIQLPWPLG